MTCSLFEPVDLIVTLSFQSQQPAVWHFAAGFSSAAGGCGCGVFRGAARHCPVRLVQQDSTRGVQACRFCHGALSACRLHHIERSCSFTSKGGRSCCASWRIVAQSNYYLSISRPIQELIHHYSMHFASAPLQQVGLPSRLATLPSGNTRHDHGALGTNGCACWSAQYMYKYIGMIATTSNNMGTCSSTS